MNDWMSNVAAVCKQFRNAALAIAGTVSIIVGIILVPVPIIPGWPLLVFGSFCFSQINND